MENGEIGGNLLLIIFLLINDIATIFLSVNLISYKLKWGIFSRWGTIYFSLFQELK